MSLTKKLVFFYLPFFILPSVIGLALLAKNYNTVTRENAKAYSDTIVSLTVDKLDAAIESYNKLSLQLLTSSEITSLLTAPTANEFERLEIQRKLEKAATPIIGGIDSRKIMACVFEVKSGVYAIGKQPESGLTAADRQAIEQQNGAPYWASSPAASEGGASGDVFRLSRVMKDDNFRPIGIFYFVVNRDVFKDILSSAMAGPNTYFELTGAQGRLLGEPADQTASFSRALRTGETLAHNGWTLTATFALSTLYATMYRMSIFAVWLALICVALGLIASQVVRSDLAVPIVKLMANMKQGLRGGPPHALRKIKGAREIRELNDTFISVMYEIHNLIAEVKKSEERKRDAQLQVLQHQLSPHFLYNTLNSIRWMAMIRKQDHIRDMVDALSHLLRYTIRDTNELVSLEDEVAIMKDFVKIQQVRYQNFSFIVDVPEELLSRRMLKLLLQPLLENAIVHGLSSIGHAGEIRLIASEEKKMLRIKIVDNGAGIEAERLEQISINLRQGNQGRHIGISNVKERIELHYGFPYGLEISSRPGGGTTVEVRLPLLESEADASNVENSDRGR